MRRSNHSKQDHEWLKKLGQNIEHLILKKGYKSPYDFWINKAGDHLSRASLNYILTGKSNPKATTLFALAKLLRVAPSKLLDFDEKK